MSWRDKYKKVDVGLYKHKSEGTFLAEKKINGKVHNKTFPNLYDAKQWRKTFDGVSASVEGENTVATYSTLKTVWESMQLHHFPSLATSTKAIWHRRYKPWKMLEHLPMDKITPSKITSWVVHWVSFYSSEEYENSGPGKAWRCNLDNELNIFVTIFNWYKESEEFEKEAVLLTCPVKKKHRKMGFIKPVPDKKKQIDLDHAFMFFSLLPELYRDLAETQFYCAGRIGEIAGLQWSNIDLENRRLIIKHTCVWCMTNKTFLELKPFPKNRESRPVFITNELMAILKRRSAFRLPGNDYVFHVEGKPLNYGTIQLNYRVAQKRGRLPYSGTHILRHGMAKLARKVGGGLDAVIAMTGHKDLKLADHYSTSNEDDQKEFSEKIMRFIREKRVKESDESASFENVVSMEKFKNGTHN